MRSRIANAKTLRPPFSASGVIYPVHGANPRVPYAHQQQAMEALDDIDTRASYSTMVVLPTGGGKTYTASSWLLREALDRGTKVLWMAHRHILLDQALDSFRKCAYAEMMPHISSFRFRVVSGSPNHDNISYIQPDDDLLIISKDCLARDPRCLDAWLAGENELFVIVDEAHHSTAKNIPAGH